MHQILDKCRNIKSVTKVYELKSQPSYMYEIQNLKRIDKYDINREA